MKKYHKFAALALVFALILTLNLALCACGTQSPEATAPIEPTNASTSTIDIKYIPVRCMEISHLSTIGFKTPYHARETFPVKVRVLMADDEGTTDYIDLEVRAEKLNFTNGSQEPLVNIINLDYTRIQEIWIKSDKLHHVDSIPDENGWTKLPFCKEHLDSKESGNIYLATVVYKLVNLGEEGNPIDTIYLTLGFPK